MKIKLKDKIKQTKGITLIALVVTIIVLLILAGISIQMLVGEGGILTNAREAKIKNTEGEEKEQIQLAYSTVMSDNYANGDYESGVTKDKLQTELRKNDEGITVESNGKNFKVTFPSSGNIYTVKQNGTVDGPTTTQTGGNDEVIPVLPGETATKTQKNNYTDDNQKSATIPEGFTVSTTDNEIDTGLVVTAPDGSEFVWVPIGDWKENLKWDWASLYPYEYGNYDYISDFENEYEAMLESKDIYEGFYVGRYETSLAGNKTQSKQGVMPMTAETDSGNTCGGMFQKQMNYASDANISSVGSSMIWESQWLAMVEWMKNGDEAEKVDEEFDKHAVCETGTTPDDVINTIYDLENNLCEMTGSPELINAYRSVLTISQMRLAKCEATLNRILTFMDLIAILTLLVLDLLFIYYRSVVLILVFFILCLKRNL